MPNYAFPVSIPVSTAQVAPVEVAADLEPGVITRVQIIFPTHCGGLAHVQVFRVGSQIWPANPDDSYATDGVPVEWTEDYSLLDRPYGFQLLGWNDDDTYPHTPIVIFTLRPAPPVQAAQQGPSLLQRLQALVGAGNQESPRPLGEG